MTVIEFDNFVKKCSTARLIKYKHRMDVVIKQRALHAFKSGVAATKTSKRAATPVQHGI